MLRYFRWWRERRRGSRGSGGRFRPRLEALEERALLSVYTVDRLTDLGEGTGLAGDLRYAITQANAMPGDDTITFGVTGTINLTGALPSLPRNRSFAGAASFAVFYENSADPSTDSPSPHAGGGFWGDS